MNGMIINIVSVITNKAEPSSHSQPPSSSPPPRYWWWRGDETLSGGEGELRLVKVSREETGNYTVTAYTQRGSVNASFFLNVQCE